MKSKIILYEAKEKCCGCEACRNVCAVNAIGMFSDEEGFLYPQIDEKKCVGCGKCITVCPFRLYERDRQRGER